MVPEPEDTFSMPSSHVVLDQVDIAFDDRRAVASAGLLLAATLAERLGVEQVTDQVVDLGDRPGAAHPGRKLLTLVHALVAGGDCIDDVELLRSGATASVLGHRVMAASTVGTLRRRCRPVRHLHQAVRDGHSRGSGASRRPLRPADHHPARRAGRLQAGPAHPVQPVPRRA
jgi:hypothetical protein